MRALERWGRLRLDLLADAAGPAPAPRARIGRYAILSEIGRTSSSIVYLAEDPELCRRVALKVLRPDAILPDYIRRFQREGKIAASLRHPNIIPIHEVGLAPDETGRPVHYIVMDHVEGGTLSGKRVGPREAAALMAAVAEAVDHAHRGGVVHRDLKPGNILMDAAGRPLVSDFGLARMVDARSALTESGAVLGTPQYMAPEQVEGRTADARTDIYALGAVLYELLAGFPPHVEENPAALLRAILHDEPRPPSALAPGTPRELEAVSLRALEKDPRRRYAAAGDLAADLRRYLDGEPVEARPVTAAGRLWRRRRVQILALAVAAVAAVAWGAVRVAKATAARHAIAGAARAEEADDLWSAREQYGRALDLDPGRAEARAGFERSDGIIRRAEAAPVEAEPPPAWSDLAGSAEGGGVSRDPGKSFQCRLAVDPAGLPVVSWRNQFLGQDEVYLRRWTGTEWADLGESATGGGVSRAPGWSRFPAVAVDRSGNPGVAWDDATSGSLQVYVKRWDGTAWMEFAGSASGVGVSASADSAEWPSLALDADGNPVVAWTDYRSEEYRVRVTRWTGSRWEEFPRILIAGGGQHPTGPTDRTPLALDPAGHPVVAWRDRSNGNWEIHLRRWNGLEWEELAGSATGGGVSATAGISILPAMALDPSGRPIVAWMDNASGNHEIYLKRFDGRSWVELAGSATGGGVSAMPGHSTNPAVAVDAAGRPIVAWQEHAARKSDIYLRRWTGAAWVEMAGSGSPGGISRTPSDAGQPEIAIDPGGNPVVAWGVTIGHPNEEVYVRRWTGVAPRALGQRRADGSRVIPAGLSASGPGVRLSATVDSGMTGIAARLEVEVRPAGEPFSGMATSRSELVEPGREASIVVPLGPGRYCWRARSADALGSSSAWVSYGGRDASCDFSIR